MKTIHQFTMNRQFFKIILDLVHTRYEIRNSYFILMKTLTIQFGKIIV